MIPYFDLNLKNKGTAMTECQLAGNDVCKMVRNQDLIHNKQKSLKEIASFLNIESDVKNSLYKDTFTSKIGMVELTTL